MNASLPKPSLQLIQKELAERSLADFIRMGWVYIDPSVYLENWHIDAICEHLQAVARGQIRRLIINIPPRHMKSIATCVAFPAWVWAQSRRGPLSGPQVRFLHSSYAERLSLRDSIKCRRLIESPWYQSNWGDRFALTGDQNTKIRFENDKFGYRIASSEGGFATGEGGDIIVIDDPHNATDISSETIRFGVLDWFDGTMSTRLNDPKTGAYVIIMQRLHEGDLTGHILASSLPGEWVHLCLPARYEPEHPYVWLGDPRAKLGELLWPERVGEPELASLERSLGSVGTAGQLQQRPAPESGSLFQKAWFETVAIAPAKSVRVRRWDLAATKEGRGATDPDWTVGLMMARDEAGLFYVEDVVRFRGSPEEVERRVLNTATQDDANYGAGAVRIALSQDPGQAGKAQVAYLTKKLAGHIISSVPETGSKEVRAQPLASQAEAGNVKLVKAEWNRAFLDELAFFPNGNHDDQVDAASGAFHELVGPKIKGEAFLEIARRINAGDLNSPAEKPTDRVLELAPGSLEYERAKALAA